MHLSGETKFFIGVVVCTVAILLGAVYFLSKAPVEIPYDQLVPSDAWATGSASAKVTLVEFSDFQCPACGSAHPAVKKIAADFADQVQFVHRHFPLEQHPFARPAALAAEAAGAQGKFWQMQDLLFENQDDLSPPNIASMAAQLGLNMEQFNKDIVNKKYEDKIERDIVDGSKSGVDSTPTFFLNGKKLSLFNFNQLTDEINKALKEANTNTK